jgi:hypothetical protein
MTYVTELLKNFPPCIQQEHLFRSVQTSAIGPT